MKRILILITAVAMPAGVAPAVIGCSSNSTYSNFMKHIHNKESFVYFMGTRDCPKCQNVKLKWWNSLTADNSKKLKEITNGDAAGGNYNADALFKKDSDAKTAYENLALYSHEINKVSNFFTDSSNKKIIKYVVDQAAKAQAVFNKSKYTPKGLTYSKIGIKGAPLFIFFDQGKYEGFENLEIDRATGDHSASQSTDPSFMYYTVQHIVRNEWPRFPTPSK